MPPASDFIATEIGGYKLYGTVMNDHVVDPGLGAKSGAPGCSIMFGVVRDFKGKDEPGGHPDFEAFMGDAPTQGLVEPALGADGKPVYASHCEAAPDRTRCPYGQMTTSRADFDQWYRSTAGVNRSYLVYLSFEANAKVYTFESHAFFPLDPEHRGTDAGRYEHNFSFTTEVHTKFMYRGGEHFSFSGDDDLWVFINGKLAIDLGGLHAPASANIDLDQQASALGLAPGHTYALDLFHAERHSYASNFRVDTTLAFTECGQVM